jgi:hypothetical protein
MSWREAFVTNLGPGYFGGTTPRIWLRVLRENQFDVDWPYWPRALAITLGSFPNALLSGWENLVYGRRVQHAIIDPPLFVLGIFRSGTTLLHNLLVQDDRFAFPNVYQCCFPKTFLTSCWNSSRTPGSSTSTATPTTSFSQSGILTKRLTRGSTFSVRYSMVWMNASSGKSGTPTRLSSTSAP